jgi:hypothetical protein
MLKIFQIRIHVGLFFSYSNNNNNKNNNNNNNNLTPISTIIQIYLSQSVLSLVLKCSE